MRASPGRERETRAIEELLDRSGPALISVTGPLGRGKSRLLSSVLENRGAVHFRTAPLPEPQLLDDFKRLIHDVLGEVPEPSGPGMLPLPSGEGGWLSVLVGLVDSIEASGRSITLALDGIEALTAARRRLPEEIAEALDRARRRGLPFRLILAGRDRAGMEALVGEGGALGPPDLSIALGPLPVREAGWAHGGRDPRDAFVRWALFGDHPAHLPSDVPSESVEVALRRRVLDPRGDLHDAPLIRLEAAFQRPARYGAILRALAPGPLDWSGLRERASGIDTGGQLAPYLNRLEEEGFVAVDQPLGAAPESRRRRYSLTDPFLAFWLAWVLPWRSQLVSRTAIDDWIRGILPGPEAHLQTWMEEASRRWLHRHSDEAFGAPAREVGALWGGEADFPVAGRLATGQVCYGIVRWFPPESGLAEEMVRRMTATRYGIGREARAPLFFLTGGGDEALRRLVAREPLARIVTLADLMGSEPPDSIGSEP